MDWSRRHGNQYGRNRLYWSDGLDRLDWPRGHGDKYGCHRCDRLDGPYWNRSDGSGGLSDQYRCHRCDGLDGSYGICHEYGCHRSDGSDRHARSTGRRWNRVHWSHRSYRMPRTNGSDRTAGSNR